MKKDENQHKNHAIVTFVGKSWISEPSFFLDIFTLEDAVFHGLSPGRIKFMGHPHFQPKSSNYLKKIEKIIVLTLFSLNDIYVKTKNIWIDREKDALSFGKSQC